MERKKLQKEINEEYDKFEKKVKPLRKKIKEIEKKKVLKTFEKNKRIIFKKSYGKNYVVLKILKSINNKGRLVYNKITIEETEDYSIHYIKERNSISKEEAKKIFKDAIND